jgi:dUTP pyrophosphatase
MSDDVVVGYKNQVPPRYATPGSAGCDLIASEEVTLAPGKWAAVNTGLYLEIPRGYVALVCPRSGLALKNAVSVLNAPGIIDSDYRGEIKVILVNHDSLRYTVKKGDRIAQLVFTPVVQVQMKNADQLTSTDRGEGGFGSTGR